MPQPYYNVPDNPEPTTQSLSQTSNICPNPLTPPPERIEQYGPVRSQSNSQVRISVIPSSDNTAAGMAQSQEDSIYLSPAPTPDALQLTRNLDGSDKMDVEHEDLKDGAKTPTFVRTYETSSDAERSTPSPSPSPQSSIFTHLPSSQDSRQYDRGLVEEQDRQTPDTIHSQTGLTTSSDGIVEGADAAHLQGLAPIDLQFNRSVTTKPWSFTNKRLTPEYPSHVFQTFSRYSGTQQSDRQIYNVDVTILTVNMAQCTMTGYLLIRGLTPEHETLQTYFTGEIIGGPPKHSEERQYYTFRTKNPAWGATEKTDLTHWARFPAWRSLSSHAKRDINFTYPTDGTNWWEQENIFMRWKEHFLVPDHKTKSIAGASFEGFYYICLNQVQGRISGIYYHSKSEKYQQLELKHEGKPDVFNRGVTPCIEFR